MQANASKGETLLFCLAMGLPEVGCKDTVVGVIVADRDPVVCAVAFEGFLGLHHLFSGSRLVAQPLQHI
jgi:hypothetical protein